MTHSPSTLSLLFYLNLLVYTTFITVLFITFYSPPTRIKQTKQFNQQHKKRSTKRHPSQQTTLQLNRQSLTASNSSNSTLHSSTDTPSPLRRRSSIIYQSISQSIRHSSSTLHIDTGDGQTTDGTETDQSTDQFASLHKHLSHLKPRKRKVLVLDLDETLIHSKTKQNKRFDFCVEVGVEGQVCLYYVYKRPFVDLFLRMVGEWFTVVIFTASVEEYAGPVIDWLDKELKVVDKRLYRNVEPLSSSFLIINLLVLII